jgi:hypothetical protein
VARRKDRAPVADSGPSVVDIELARQWVAASHFVKRADHNRPFADRELEAEAMELATRIHHMSELF